MNQGSNLNRSWYRALFLQYGQTVLARCAATYQTLCDLPRHVRRRVQAIAGTSLATVALAIALQVSPAGALPTAISVTPGMSGVAVDGGCSLVEAVLTANDGGTHGDCSGGTAGAIDTINLTGQTYSYTAAYAGSSTALPTITDSLILNGNGAVITRSGSNAFNFLYVSGTDATVNNVVLSGGQAPLSGLGYHGMGGAIRGANADITLNESLLTGNVAQRGGGVYIRLSSLTVNDGAIVANRANSLEGGGIRGFQGSVTLNRSIVSGNQASRSGGGISSYRTDVTLNNSQLEGNFAGLGLASASGGGLAVEGRASQGAVTIHDSEIRHNFAPNQGGGIYLTATPSLQIDQTTIANNEAQSGGGGGISAPKINGANMVANSTISGNRSGGNGGGIYSKEPYANMSIVRSTLNDNVAAGKGGAVFNEQYNKTLTIQHSTISGNEAGTSGGGIYVKRIYLGLDSTSTVIVDNSTMTGNQAAVGGAIHNQHTGMFIRRSIVSGNSATTSDAEIRVVSVNGYSYDGRPPVFGTITAGGSLFGHSGVSNTAAFGEASPAWVTASDESLTSDGGTPTAIGAILNPTLADNGGETASHALVSGSPAINHVISGASGVSDQRYAPRVANEDAGAVEFGAVVPEARINGTFCALGEAITAANTDTATGDCAAGTAGLDTIELLKDVTLTAALPAVTSTITIEGNGRSIDANNQALQLLHVTTAGGDLMIQEAMLTGVNNLPIGPIKVDAGSNLTLSDSTVHNNTHAFYTGTIYNLGTVTLENVTVSHNRGIRSHGAIRNFGDLTLIHSVITQNTTGWETSSGVTHYDGVLTMENSIISGNPGSEGLIFLFLQGLLIQRGIICLGTALRTIMPRWVPRIRCG